MANNLYDKNGNYIGRVMSDQEKADEDFGNFSDTIGCFGIIIAVFLVLVLIGPWIVAIIACFFDGEWGYLFFAIPVLVATVIVGKKIKEWKIQSIWGAFLRTVLIGTGAGTVGGCILWVVNPDFVYGYSTVVEAIVPLAGVGLWYAIGPAAIVAWRVYKSKKK